MRRNNRRKWYVNLFFLLALNLFFFFSLNLLFTHSNLLPSKTLTQNHRHLSTQNPHLLTPNRHSLTQTLPNGASVTLHGKPWPILPSFLPWLQNSPPRPKSCEGYFGNGFTRRIDLLRPPEGSLRVNDFGSSSGKGWFRCFYSETLQSSICEGGRIRMVPGRIRMSAGGEKLASVIGRSEGEELPEFEPGAFEIQVGKGFGGSRKIVSEEFLDRFVPRGQIGRHTMRDLMASINAVELDDTDLRCHEWVEDTTLFVTRFEYANLFHTVTDWYSAYVASRVAGLPNRPHLVFVDGHCKAPLEETWKALFSTIRYAKNFTSSVCFRHAVISPLGYETALFKGLSEPIDCQGGPAHELWENPDDTKTARLSEFGEMLRAAFGLPLDKHRVHKRTTVHNVLFIRREDYLAHPRHGGKVESRLSNEQEVFDALKTWASTYSKCHVNLVNGLFAHMPMKEQFRAIQDASVIIGAHGAGLTHVIAATPKTVVLEIISSLYKRPHFELISKWRGLEYHAIDLPASVANPTTVREKLRSILRNFGC